MVSNVKFFWLPKKDAWALALLTGVVFLFFFPLIFGNATLFSRDITAFVYPLKHYLHESLQQNTLPFWSPHLFHGMPLMGTLFPGVLYPPNVIFLLNDFTTAFNWFYVGHFWGLILSTYALTRYWKLSIAASLVSALTAGLSGFFLACAGINAYFLTVVWLPSVLLFFQRVWLKNRPGDWVLGILCLVCQVLAGSPEVNVMTVLLVYFFCNSLEPIRSRWSLWLGRTVRFAFMVLLTLGLCAPQLFSTYSLVEQSVRTEGLDYEHHTHWSMKPSAASEVLLSKDHSNFMENIPSEKFNFIQSFHMGWFAGASLFMGVIFWRLKPVRFWSFAFLIGLVFSLGKHNPIYFSMYKVFPVMDMFRFPEKFYFISAWAQVFLAGHVFEALLNPVEPYKNRGIPFWTVLIAPALAVLLLSWNFPDRLALVNLLMFALLGLGFWSYNNAHVKKHFLTTGIVLLIFVDLMMRHHMLVPMIERDFYENVPEPAQLIQSNPAIYRTYSGRVFGDLEKMMAPAIPNKLSFQKIKQKKLVPFRGVSFGIQYPNGIPGVGLELSAPNLWREIFRHSSPEKRLRILKRSNVKYWVVDDRPEILPKELNWVASQQVVQLEDSLPRAFLVPGFQLGKSPHLLNTYYDINFDPLKTVLLEESIPITPTENFSASIDFLLYETDKLTLLTQQQGDGFLVLLDSYSPDWTVTVDEQPTRVLRANHFFRAVKLSPGKHTVIFTYQPQGYKTGLVILFISLALLGAVCYRLKTSQTPASKPEASLLSY